jgi:hypothetical protein
MPPRLVPLVRALAVALGLALGLVPLAARGGTRPEGTVSADEGRVELLATPLPVGVRIERPEGWFRVEEAGPEDREVGSFAVVAWPLDEDARADARAAARASAGLDPEEEPIDRPPETPYELADEAEPGDPGWEATGSGADR